MSYSVLEHLFLLWNVLSCFGSFYSVLEQPKPQKCWKITEKSFKKWWKKIEKLLKNVILPKVRVRSATTSNYVRTLIWTCDVRACDPKNGRNSHLASSVLTLEYWINKNCISVPKLKKNKWSFICAFVIYEKITRLFSHLKIDFQRYEVWTNL